MGQSRSRPEHLSLSRNQKRLLCECWSTIIRREPELFAKGWIKTILRNEDIRKMFELSDKAEPLKDFEFHQITVRVKSFFQSVIDDGLDEDSIRQKCIDLGWVHSTKLPKLIQRHHWQAFEDCMTEVIQDANLTILGVERQTLNEAIIKLITIVTRYTEEGYNDE